MSAVPDRTVVVLLASQAVRGLGYGVAAVQIGALMGLEGLSATGVGLVLAAILVGSFLASLVLARWGDRLGRRRAYAGLYAALLLCGLVIATGLPWWLLAVVAVSGAMSVEVIESGPFTTLEQVMLAGTGRPQKQIVRGFGLYNAIAAVAGTLGAFLGGLPEDRRLLGGVLAGTAAAGMLLTFQLPATVEAPSPAPGPGLAQSRMLARSRGSVTRLAGLFATDSLAGGFVIQAYVGYWLTVRFGATTHTIGVTFAVAGILQTVSLLAAPRLANRIGLLPTMVFTHLPANVMLAAVPFAPTLPAVISLLLGRACLSSMDVPTRQAYVMAMVPPEERTAAAAITNTARYLTRPLGPALAGMLQSISLAAPFLVAGVTKMGYDLVLWRLFRNIQPPTDLPPRQPH